MKASSEGLLLCHWNKGEGIRSIHRFGLYKVHCSCLGAWALDSFKGDDMD
jgi:hypothetical protein